MKINIVSKNPVFAEDLRQQIEFAIKDADVSTDLPDSSTTLLLVDEDEKSLPNISSQNKEMPVVLLSSKKDASDFADIVIKKPLKLNSFLKALKEETLIPKVRRKECLMFKEYSLYPVKKEIFSSQTQNTTKLTEKEVDIIKYLYQNAPQIASKEELLEKVWEYSTDATTHTVETHIYRLRQKVEKDGSSQLIITENNGYKLNV